MAKKDIELKEESDRPGPDQEKQSVQEHINPEEKDTGFTEVKNAHATGLGSIGRREEKQPGTEPQGADY